MSSCGEHWSTVPNAGGFYEASSMGRIRSVDRTVETACRWGGVKMTRLKGRVLKTWTDSNGYPCVYLCFDGKRTAMNVHRIIANTFLGDGCGALVNHKDGCKSNNQIENLEWCTRSENMHHARETGLLKDRKPLIATPVNGGQPLSFGSLREASNFVGASRNANIWAAAHGRTKTAYGYKWKFAAQAA